MEWTLSPYVLGPLFEKGHALYKLIYSRQPVDTEKLYIKLVRANALGKLDDMHSVLFRFVEGLAEEAEAVATVTEKLSTCSQMAETLID